MRWASLRVTAATIAIVSLPSACKNDAAGPGDPVLTGQFGAADLPVELLATHAGIELSQPCGAYFAAERAASLEANGAFRVRGESHVVSEGATSTKGATLSGRIQVAGGIETVTVTLLPDGPGTAADLLVMTLRRAEHYAGPEIPCAL